MSRSKIFLTLLVLATSYSTAYGDHSRVGEPYLQPNDPSSHRNITATVTRVASDMVFFKTDAGTIRTYGMKDVKRDGMPSIKPGNQVDLILDARANTILAVAPPHGTGAYIGDEVTGTVQRFDWVDRRITLNTGKGEIQSFEVRAAVVTKLIGVDKGSPVTLEMDGHNRAFDAYRAE
jgi:hypothetical protein